MVRRRTEIKTIEAMSKAFVRSDLKGRDFGMQLMPHLIACAKADTPDEISGAVLDENCAMPRMCVEFDLTVEDDSSDARLTRVVLDLP